MIQRKFHEWRLGPHTIRLGERTLITGLLNLVPGERYADPDRAHERALEMQAAGAGAFELAGTELSPKAVAEAEEIRRVVPVVKRLRDLGVPVIVRTWKQAVAEKALANGAAGIHDISGLTWNPDLAKLTVQNDAALILNHLRGTPEEWAAPAAVKDIVDQAVTGLGAAAHRANRANVDRQRILVDAGFGMGKRREHNLEILSGLAKFGTLGVPVGVSLAGEPFLARGEETESDLTYASVVTAAVLNGAYVVTTADVEQVRVAVQLADALLVSKAQVPEAPVAPSPRSRANPSGREESPTRARLRPALRRPEGRGGER